MAAPRQHHHRRKLRKAPEPRSSSIGRGFVGRRRWATRRDCSSLRSPRGVVGDRGRGADCGPNRSPGEAGERKGNRKGRKFLRVPANHQEPSYAYSKPRTNPQLSDCLASLLALLATNTHMHTLQAEGRDHDPVRTRLRVCTCGCASGGTKGGRHHPPGPAADGMRTWHPTRHTVLGGRLRHRRAPRRGT